MTLKIASTVFATNQGLGILAKSFFDHGLITHPVMIRHGKHENHPEWYPKDTPVVRDLRRDCMRVMDEVLKEVDLFLAFETPFEWAIFRRCKERGVKSVLMPMYECEPERLPSTPDLFLNPSLLDQRYYPSGIFLPVPVDTEKVTWRKRERARVFVHNAGHGGLLGRNGTEELLQAWHHVKSPAELIVRAQSKSLMDRRVFPSTHPRIKFHIETVPYERLFEEGDVFIFPEKFNGLSLPLQEARASGMLVMCGRRFPMATWLPNEPLIKIKSYKKSQIGPPYNVFDEAVFDKMDIAAKVDEWFDKDISTHSEQGRAWAEAHSWESMKPDYIEVFENLVGE